MRRLIFLYSILILASMGMTIPGLTVDAQESLDRTATQWLPIEWRVDAPNVGGNPFDVIATVTFTHAGSSETRQTQMFYDGGTTWAFRFTGTQPGEWTFNSSSDVAALNGLNGTVTVTASSEYNGFVANIGNKWAHGATGEVFTPQFVMGGGPQYYYADLNRISQDVDVFLNDHGFNGIHVMVLCRWFEINTPTCDSNTPDVPDLRTFETLDAIITQVYEAGGVVHLWVWGDTQRGWNPQNVWGLNSVPDKRLQRYIAARLGPLPGWTMGYGFDLFEWVTTPEIDEWHAYMHQHLGWDHYLGGRGLKDSHEEISPNMDYASYEHYRPDYEWFRVAMEIQSERPVFAEDRYRVQNIGRSRDFTEPEALRLMWYSMMVGGVANIWGHLGDQSQTSANSGGTTSLPYPNKQWIQTHFRFWEDRFFVDMVICNTVTDGYCLGGSNGLVFYKEDATSISINLEGYTGNLRAVAVDTMQAYQEIDLGTLTAGNQTWQAPYSSDWAIAIGFDGSTSEPAPTPTEEATAPVDVQQPSGTVTDSGGRPVYTWAHDAPTTAYELYLAPTNNLIATRFYGTLTSADICNATTCAVDLTTITPNAWLTNDTFSLFINPAPGNVNTWQGPFLFTIDEPQPQAITPGTTDLSNPARPAIQFTLEGTAANAAFFQVYMAPTADLLDATINTWYTREQLCGSWDGTTCAVSPDANIPTGTEYAAYIRSWGPGGFSTGGLGGAADGWVEITFTS